MSYEDLTENEKDLHRDRERILVMGRNLETGECFFIYNKSLKYYMESLQMDLGKQLAKDPFLMKMFTHIFKHANIEKISSEVFK